MLMMTERMKTLGQMEQSGLALKLTAEYTEQQINACCDQLEDEALDKNAYQKCFSIQAALITVPGFSERLRFLLENGVSAYQVEQWLSTANETGCGIMDYSAQELIYLFSMRMTDMRGKQEFARYYRHILRLFDVLPAVAALPLPERLTGAFVFRNVAWLIGTVAVVLTDAAFQIFQKHRIRILNHPAHGLPPNPWRSNRYGEKQTLLSRCARA